MWAARARYVALLNALRRADGTAARAHLTRMTQLERQAEGSALSADAPPRHVDYLTAYVNMLLKQYDRAAQVLESLPGGRRRAGADEGRLLRTAYDQMAHARIKAGDVVGAVKLWKAAQAIEKDAATDSNLAVADWRRGKRRGVEKVWAALVGQVAEASFNLAVALDARGKHEEAWRSYLRYAKSGGAHAAKAREVADAKQRIFGFGGEE